MGVGFRSARWLGLMLLAACGEGGVEDTDGAARAQARADGLVALSAADSAATVQRAEPLATALAQGLAQRLQARLASDGAAGAVDFCSIAALPLTDSLAAEIAAGATMKRTSTRLRNPANAPDALEARALAWFDSVQAATGELPPHHVQATDDEVRYYRPLVIAPFCTQCHGPLEEIDPAARAILAERYPEDRAVGYRAGDLRGVLRVSMPRSAR